MKQIPIKVSLAGAMGRCFDVCEFRPEVPLAGAMGRCFGVCEFRPEVLLAGAIGRYFGISNFRPEGSGVFAGRFGPDCPEK